MSKHTPKPWSVWDQPNADRLHARLIAAAPDLYAVVKDVKAEIVCRCDESYLSRGRHAPNTLCHLIPDVDAALSKVEGKVS